MNIMVEFHPTYINLSLFQYSNINLINQLYAYIPTI